MLSWKMPFSALNTILLIFLFYSLFLTDRYKILESMMESEGLTEEQVGIFCFIKFLLLPAFTDNKALFF